MLSKRLSENDRKDGERNGKERFEGSSVEIVKKRTSPPPPQKEPRTQTLTLTLNRTAPQQQIQCLEYLHTHLQLGLELVRTHLQLGPELGLGLGFRSGLS